MWPTESIALLLLSKRFSQANAQLTTDTEAAELPQTDIRNYCIRLVTETPSLQLDLCTVATTEVLLLSTA